MHFRGEKRPPNSKPNIIYRIVHAHVVFTGLFRRHLGSKCKNQLCVMCILKSWTMFLPMFILLTATCTIPCSNWVLTLLGEWSRTTTASQYRKPLLKLSLYLVKESSLNYSLYTVLHFISYAYVQDSQNLRCWKPYFKRKRVCSSGNHKELPPSFPL